MEEEIRKPVEEVKKSRTEKLEIFYNKNYKKLMIIPLLVLAISIAILGISYFTTGQFIEKDVSLTGGISVTIETEKGIDIDDLRSEISSKFPDSDVDVRRLTDFTTGRQLGFTVEVSKITNQDLKPVLEEYLNTELDQGYSAQETGAGLGASFFRELIYAILIAFILMAITVFIIFRKPIPCIAINFSVILDITATLAIISLLGIKLSSAGIAAFLMIIGYSIDTDILLATYALKRQGPSFEKTLKAFKTGITMTLATIAALSVALLITNSQVLEQIFTIILIALFVDIISTYLMNAPLLTWYVKKNEPKTI